MRRYLNLLLIPAALAGCGSFDKFLEGSQPSDARLKVVLASSGVTVIAGQEATLSATVTRIGDYSGPVALTVEGAPVGVTAEVASGSTSGAVTSATLTIRVGAGAAPGEYTLAVRGHAAPIPVDNVATLVLVIAPAPAFSVTVSQTAFTLVQGGIVPVAVAISRTNLPFPVTLSIQGSPQVSAVFASNPVNGSSAGMTLSVRADAAPGTYSATLHASAAGLADRTVVFSVTVTNDPLQVVVSPSIDASQGSIVPVGLILNRNGYAGTVSLSVEDLPAGVTASFDPAGLTGSTGSVELTIQPSVVAATYPIRIRGRGTGVPDATADAQLAIKASGLSLQLFPQSVSVYEGSNTTATLTLTRTALDADVTISMEGAPPGLSVAPTPVLMTTITPTVFFTVAATAGTAAGQYTLTVRATPAGWPPGASVTTTLGVTVRSLPSGIGNVILDWSACAQPDWVAVQDGSGPWTQVIPVSGGVRFSVNSAKGGVAFVEGGNTVSVRYLTQSEFTARPLDMCPPAPPASTRTVTGTGVHTSALEQFSYALGGATATSTAANPNFSLIGVREGVNDLVAWGTTSGAAGLRGLLRRDQDLADGESLGSVDLLGADSFSPLRAALTISGQAAGETVTHSMEYLTTPACSVNPMYGGTQGTSAQMAGVPASLQRDSDFHLLTVSAALGARVRVATVAFRALGTRFLTLSQLTAAPTVTSLGGPYKRLRAVLGTFSVLYNGAAAFRYVSGIRTMSVVASIGYTGSSVVELAMPDFSGVSGWPNGAAIPADATGFWNQTLDGKSTLGSRCTEGRTSAFMNHTGPF